MTIPKDCKRLAEVDFPIAVVSKHSAREKSIRHGHPSTLHLWWARRPLAACRAMLLALLWPDPCDPNCPEEFKEKAREVLAPLPGKVGTTDEDLRKALLKFIGDFADWDRSSDPVYLEASRVLVKAAHGDEPPLVVDPFAGGGSIPLEALRVGCDTFASDLNPVACLILKVMLEDIPRWGRQKLELKKQNGEEIEAHGLVEALRIVGKEIKDAAEKAVKEFYPDDEDGARPIAYLWARTVRCESPNCGAEIPLMRSFWLSKKERRKYALRYQIMTKGEKIPEVEFEIFEPKYDSEVPSGNITRAKATCLCCNNVLTPERVRSQLAQQKGGSDPIFRVNGERIGGARLTAVVTLKTGQQGRCYRLPNPKDYKSVWDAQKLIEKIALDKLSNGLSVIPDEPTPAGGGSGAGRAFSIQKYGMMVFGDLFSARQKLGLINLCSSIANRLMSDTLTGSALAEITAGVVSKRADYGSSSTKWHLTFEKTTCTFGRQALPMTWDFVEPTPIGETSGAYGAGLASVLQAVETICPSLSQIGQTELADAADFPLPDSTCQVWFTDPPYYDAVPYSDLSDFFMVWLRRALLGHPLLTDPFDLTNSLTPKSREVVQDETKKFQGAPKDRRFFEARMSEAFAEGSRVLDSEGIGCVVFAHKTTEGWEALLSGMIKGGWTITGSWPIATERPGRLRSQESAALATSVHLVCRPRPEDAPIGDWSDVLRELPKRVGDWMGRLQSEGIRGADLVFACIGPALEIFSRYSKVETADGKEVTLAEYLEKVWEVVGRSALEQVLGISEAQVQTGAAGALEEDARLTALFLWTLQSTNGENGSSKKEKGKRNKMEIEGEEEIDENDDEEEEESGKGKSGKGFSLIFDVVRRFAQPLGIHLPEWEARIIETKKGVVRLLSVSERAKQLFGTDGAQTVADQIEQSRGGRVQGMLFPDMEGEARRKVKGKRKMGEKSVIVEDNSSILPSGRREATTLDRVHAAMLLQAGGRANALRALIKEEMDRGGEFLRLANALSALYPRTSEEKRLLDAMLLAVPK